MVKVAKFLKECVEKKLNNLQVIQQFSPKSMAETQLLNVPQQRVPLPQPLPGIFQQRIFKQPKYDLRRIALPSESSWILFKPIQKNEASQYSTRMTRSIDINYSTLDIPPSNPSMRIQQGNFMSGSAEPVLYKQKAFDENDDIPVRGNSDHTSSKPHKQKSQPTPHTINQTQKQKSKSKAKQSQRKNIATSQNFPQGSALLLPLTFRDVPTRFRQFGKFGEFRQSKFKNKK